MDILALTKVVMDREKELMCFECGNITMRKDMRLSKFHLLQDQQMYQSRLNMDFLLHKHQQNRGDLNIINQLLVCQPLANKNLYFIHELLLEQLKLILFSRIEEPKQMVDTKDFLFFDTAFFITCT